MTSFTICRGSPQLNGLYVVYVQDDMLSEWCEEEFRSWQDGKWMNAGSGKKVFGWIGPLPAFKHGETKPVEPPMEFDL